MKKNGFTLIELLAVIVILAIIALIATPAVLNIIEDSRKAAAEASVRNIMSAAKTYKVQQVLKGNEIEYIDLSDGVLKYDGEQATKGLVEMYGEENIIARVYINGYCVKYAEGEFKTIKQEESACNIYPE